jgi:hypothetical protein
VTKLEFTPACYEVSFFAPIPIGNQKPLSLSSYCDEQRLGDEKSIELKRSIPGGRFSTPRRNGRRESRNWSSKRAPQHGDVELAGEENLQAAARCFAVSATLR